MKHLLISLSALSLLFCGCRREDIREFTVEIPGLTASNQAQVVEAFNLRTPGSGAKVYDGIDTSSFKFDLEKKTLTLKYDSMKIAQTNIRMLIQDKGVEVFFPSNTTGRAGY